jgi:hypothetical protein
MSGPTAPRSCARSRPSFGVWPRRCSARLWSPSCGPVTTPPFSAQPAPDHQAVQVLNAETGECALVGDSVTDVQGARLAPCPEHRLRQQTRQTRALERSRRRGHHQQPRRPGSQTPRTRSRSVPTGGPCQAAGTRIGPACLAELPSRPCLAPSEPLPLASCPDLCLTSA